MNRTKLLLSVCLVAAACSQIDKAAINSVLDARNAAITARDIAAYSDLIALGYRDRGHNKVDEVARMVHLFDQFDALDMRVINREIRLVDRNHADCAQTYRLRVHGDGQWRALVQREELSLKRTAAGWKISAGL